MENPRVFLRLCNLDTSQNRKALAVLKGIHCESDTVGIGDDGSRFAIVFWVPGPRTNNTGLFCFDLECNVIILIEKYQTMLTHMTLSTIRACEKSIPLACD